MSEMANHRPARAATRVVIACRFCATSAQPPDAPRSNLPLNYRLRGSSPDAWLHRPGERPAMTLERHPSCRFQAERQNQGHRCELATDDCDGMTRAAKGPLSSFSYSRHPATWRSARLEWHRTDPTPGFETSFERRASLPGNEQGRERKDGGSRDHVRDSPHPSLCEQQHGAPSNREERCESARSPAGDLQASNRSPRESSRQLSVCPDSGDPQCTDQGYESPDEQAPQAHEPFIRA